MIYEYQKITYVLSHPGDKCILNYMDKNYDQQITQNLIKIGLSREHARLYLMLWSTGRASVVQISRQLSMGRNKVYRLLRELQELNLINQINKQNSSEYEALDYDNLKLLVAKKKEDLEIAESGFDQLIKQLPYVQSASSVSSKVQHYYGINGLKQVNWNLVHTKDMYRVYEVSRLSSYLDEKFAEDLRNEWLRRKIHSRDLTNDTIIEDHTKISEFTQQYSQYRHIDPKILKIETEIYIYNDIVAVLQYDNLKYDPNSIFCVEIHNRALADFQRQVYDILWEQAKPFKLVSPYGRRILE